MTLITRRPWRSRQRGLRPSAPRWPMPFVALYWRRVKARAQCEWRRVPAAEGRVIAPMTFVSVHQHVHPAAPASIRMAASQQFVLRPPTASTIVMTRLIERAMAARAAAVAPGTLRASDGPSPAAGTMRSPSAPSARETSRGAAPVPVRDRARPVSTPTRAFAARAGRPPGTPEPPLAAWPRARRAPSRLETFVPRRARTTAAVIAPRMTVGAAAERHVPIPRLSSRIPAAGSVALEWRAPQAKPHQAPAIAVAGRADQRVAVHGRPSAAVAIDTPTAAQPSVRRDTAPGLDPSTIDRLADTVMQRIDRRIRIERERRGL